MKIRQKTEIEINQASLDNLDKWCKGWDGYKTMIQRQDFREKNFIKGEKSYCFGIMKSYYNNKFQLMEGFSTYKMR